MRGVYWSLWLPFLGLPFGVVKRCRLRALPAPSGRPRSHHTQAVLYSTGADVTADRFGTDGIPLFARATAVILLMPSVASAQEVTEPALKAAFIYSFMKFTEWPDPLPVSDPFVICVLNDPAVGGALERAVKGREFAGRRMIVLLSASAPKEQRCRVLYYPA